MEVLLRCASSNKIAGLIDGSKRENIRRDVIGGRQKSIIDPNILSVLIQLISQSVNIVGRERVRIGSEFNNGTTATRRWTIGSGECAVRLTIEEHCNANIRVIRLVVVHEKHLLTAWLAVLLVYLDCNFRLIDTTPCFLSHII